MIQQLKNVAHKAHDLAVHPAHAAERPCHLAYFGMVALESGHWYGIAAGILFVLTLVVPGGSDD